MKSKVLATAALTAIMLTACGVNNNGANDNALGNRDAAELTRVNNPANNNNGDLNGNVMTRQPNVDNVRNIDTENMRNNTENARNNGNETSKIRVEDLAASRIAGLKVVEHANVIVVDNNAYVAAKLTDNTNDLSRDVERRIADQVKSVDNSINNVYVSVNPNFYDRMNSFAGDIRNGRSINGFFNEFTNAVRDVFPTHFNR